MKKIFVFTFSIIMLASINLLAHGGKDHDKKKKEEQTEQSHHHDGASVNHTELKIDSHIHNEEEEHNVVSEDFSTLHPLIVHFPIVMLILVVFSQLASFFIFTKELNWVTLFLLVGGFIGAYLAANNFHPHTEGLTTRVQEILETHEYYSYNVVILTGVIIIMKIILMALGKRARKIEILTIILILVNAYFISLSGHYGAKLIHIEGIGAKGNFIELHE